MPPHHPSRPNPGKGDELMSLAFDNSHLSKPRKPVSVPTEAWETAPNSKVRRYIECSVAENTRKAYDSDLKHFLNWGGDIPAGPELVAAYLADHADEHAFATLQRRLATISRAHTSRGLETPTTSALVKATLRGIGRVHGKRQKRVTAITTKKLKTLIAPLGNYPKDLRDKALLLIGFAGAFRRSELVSIDVNHIEWLSDRTVITLPRSKTDQMGEGRTVVIPCGSNGDCPVQALKDWLDTAGITEGPVFRSVSRYSRALKRLSTNAVATIIKERAAAVGLDPEKVSGHSLRAGFDTTAAMLGAPAWKIKQHTGHATDAMLQKYIRAAHSSRALDLPST